MVATEGLSKASLGKMRNLDSFLKESQRVNGVAQRKHTDLSLAAS